MTDEDYNKLPLNFKKLKKQHLEDNPELAVAIQS